MKTLALHILDILQNSIRAQADLIELSIIEDLTENTFKIIIKDNGKGMDDKIAENAIDPFFTTRKTRNVGLGLSLLKQNAERTGGYLKLNSEIDKGTNLEVMFKHDSIDRPVLGDIAGVICLTSTSNQNIDFIYHHKTDSGKYSYKTKEIKNILKDINISDPEIMRYLKSMINENLENINADNKKNRIKIKK